MELTLFHSGSGTRFVGDHIGAFTSGDLVLLGERLPHCWHASGDSSGYSVQWDFSAGHPIWGLPEAAALASLRTRASLGRWIVGNTAEQVRGILSQMIEAPALERLGLLFQIFARLQAMSEEDAPTLSGRTFELTSASTHQDSMAEAVLYLVSHFREEVRLEDLLKRVGMSKTTFSRQFRLHAGRTFQEFLLSLRLQAALGELLHSRDPITEIAMRSGFSHIAFFNRAFRGAYGCSPSQMRKNPEAYAAGQILAG
jgi:AraC-like DNA-binding protein